MNLLRDLIKLGVAGTTPSGAVASMESCTWAARPNAATHLGAMIYVTDVGINGSIWISNGTVWRPTAPVVLFSDLDVFTAATSATEQIAAQINIPAGLMADGSNLRVMFAGEKSGTTDATAAVFKLRMGTAGTTSDVLVAGGLSLAQANLSMGVQSLIGRSSSSTEVQKLGASGIGSVSSWNGATAVAPAPKVTVGNLDTENNILTFTVQPGGTVDVVSVTSLLVELV